MPICAAPGRLPGCWEGRSAIRSMSRTGNRTIRMIWRGKIKSRSRRWPSTSTAGNRMNTVSPTGPRGCTNNCWLKLSSTNFICIPVATTPSIFSHTWGRRLSFTGGRSRFLQERQDDADLGIESFHHRDTAAQREPNSCVLLSCLCDSVSLW